MLAALGHFAHNWQNTAGPNCTGYMDARCWMLAVGSADWVMFSSSFFHFSCCCSWWCCSNLNRC